MPSPAFLDRVLVFGLLLLSGAGLSAAEFTCTLTSAKEAEPVADAAVALIPLDTAPPPPAPDRQTEITQQDQEFFNYVTIVQAGSDIAFPNRDNVQHHVYSLSRAKKFELPLYDPGQRETMVFETAGEVVIGCNIHDWMIAYIVVVPTPWFARSGADGTVAINAPAGRYRLEIWHPRIKKTITQEITLTDSTPTGRSESIALKPDRRIRRGGGGISGGYR